VGGQGDKNQFLSSTTTNLDINIEKLIAVGFH
jgi:hypothetical protein